MFLRAIVIVSDSGPGFPGSQAQSNPKVSQWGLAAGEAVREEGQCEVLAIGPCQDRRQLLSSEAEKRPTDHLLLLSILVKAELGVALM